MRPYSRVMVAVDNSPHSQKAQEWALAFAKGSGAALTAVHVYNAGQHELAFRRMEAGLPPEHRNPAALAKQREAHQTLIHQSLALIAASYLAGIEKRCLEEEVPFQAKTIEGKHYLALCEEATNHNLICIGAHGLGWLPGSVMGSVCERVLRRCREDALIVKVNRGCIGNPTPPTEEPPPPNKIAVGVDGSESSLAAVGRAAGLASIFGASLEAIYVFDPFFHRLAFGRMKGVLSREAECLFRFGEQESLHDTVIDEGLAQVGQEHLRKASEASKPLAEQMKRTVLSGKPFLRISEHLESEGADLLVVGRFGSHFHPEADIGSTAENLARLAPCSVMIVNSQPALEQGRG